MRSVYKFSLGSHDSVIEVPQTRDYLSVLISDSSIISLYYAVDPESPKVKIRIKSVNTGHAIEMDKYIFRATVASPVTGIIWHVFESLILE